MVLALLLIVTVLPMSAMAAGDFTFTISDGGATITGYTGGGGYVTIPDQVEDGGAYYPVVAIGDNAFQGNGTITGLYIPCSVVGTYAFFQCGALQSVTFAGSVSQIRGYSFAQCPNLKSFTFLHSNAAFVGIEPYAFQLTGPLTDTSVTVSSANNINPYIRGYDWGGSMRKVTFSGMDPAITLQPVSQTVEENTPVTFTVSATPAGMVKYQWYYRTSPTGAWMKCDAAASTNATYTYSPSLDKSGYQYYVEVRNDYGAIASNVATLTVVKPTAAPVITRQPQNVTVNAGSKAIFEVQATGAGLNYQWYYKAPTGDWTEVDAAYGKNPTYELTTDPDMHQNGYSYHCVITNTGGTVTTNTVILTVQTGVDAPMITKQPLNVIVDKGEAAVFKLEATGTNLKYQWWYKTPTSEWFKCNAGTGDTTNTYTLADPTNQSGYSYRCIVTNDAGTAVSNTVTLTVRTAANELKILTQPRSVVATSGQPAYFSVLAQGIGVIYQWYVKTPGGAWKVIDGAIGSTYTVTADQTVAGNQYKVVVANAQGSITSDVVTLAVNGAGGAAPIITVYPTDVMVTVGKPASFRAEAAGTGLTYQWYYKSSPTGAWVKCSEAPANGTIYTLPAAKAVQNGFYYRCGISNASGTSYTPEVRLYVTAVDAAPQINVQPTSVTVNAGNSATFNVVAAGTDLNYQWYYRTPTSGWMKCDAAVSTYPTYTIPATESRQNGFEYRCEIWNLAGKVVTSTVTLTVVGSTGAPVITAQPTAQTVLVGQEAHFEVQALNATSQQWYYRIGGSGTWYKCDANPSNNQLHYHFTTQAHQNGYEYRCEIKNSHGSVISNTVKLTVMKTSEKPVILQHPMAQNATEGENATFYVIASGSGLSYQWYYRIASGAGWMKCDFNPMDAKSAVYHMYGVEARQNGFEYCCEVSNSAGKVTSNVAKLTVVGVPVTVTTNLIKTQPTNQTAPAGGTAVFAVEGKETGLTYQWYYRPGGTEYWYKCDFAAATGATYTMNGVQARQNGFEYRCAVSKGNTVEYSQIVKLTVT